MKVALVHDWLDSRIGGAEEVFLTIAKLYPEADVFTLLYNKKVYGARLTGRRIHVSYLRFFPKFFRKKLALLLPFIKSAVRSHDLSGYDLVISDSSAWSKNIRVPEGTMHICYCHSPARMIWDSWPGYLDQFSIARNKLIRFYLIWLVSKLRLWDFYASEGVDHFIANSHYIAARIKKFYGREAKVIYPPVQQPKSVSDQSQSAYWLVLSTLARYKNIDVAIKAFIRSGRRLVVAGDGAARSELEQLAQGHDNVEIIGRVDDAQKWQLLSGAQALLFANIEDFGITPVEANMAGRPVVALRGGGVRESMVEAKTAIFFDELAVEAINQAVSAADKTKWDKTVLRKNAARFAEEKFTKELQRYIREKCAQ